MSRPIEQTETTELSCPPRQPPLRFQMSEYNSSQPVDGTQTERKRRKEEVEHDKDTVGESGVRRRISRACDQCNQHRTRCDGRKPCASCVDGRLQCEYARAQKKRGRLPKSSDSSVRLHDGGDSTGGKLDPAAQTNSGFGLTARSHLSTQRTGNGTPSVISSAAASTTRGSDPEPATSTGPASRVGDIMTMPTGQSQMAIPTPSMFHTGLDTLQNAALQQGYGFPLGHDYSVAFMGKPPMVESPDWMAFTSPMFISEPAVFHQPRSSEPLRFPVLQSLLPHIESVLPQNLACDLLEQYFATSSSTYLRPSNPYILGNIFRKSSILHPTHPRSCSAALLASMLWIAAQTSDAGFLTYQLDTRTKICQGLLELAIKLLKPLVHNPSAVVAGTSTYPLSRQLDPGLGSLVTSPEQGDVGDSEHSPVDDIVTYTHIATVVSASERKAASLRWWNAAWSLAREVKLGRELPPDEGVTEPRTRHDGTQAYPGSANESRNDPGNLPTGHEGMSNTRSAGKRVSEEEREERRRTWWLLYMQDRHLALCYNRPMFFLNKECENLLRPLDDDVWQAGCPDQNRLPRRGPGLDIECTSHSIFGYFLPLMVILGEILDLNHARNRPRFGPKADLARNWDGMVEEITHQLEVYGRSLRRFQGSMGVRGDTGPRETGSGSDASVASSGTASSYVSPEVTLQTQTVAAYGTHIMHVLHILLTGKWDPIALLDENDLWISSRSFVTATEHAVNAAEAVSHVIDLDPDLSFMPFFFGIYLLQGSFLLLFFADRLRGDVSSEVVKACETIVRAHEACVATLDTQYQRNFRKVMRSALQQVRGRNQEDPTEQQLWRREVLKLYRWTGDGTGLAL